jgi:hypothetical protein
LLVNAAHQKIIEWVQLDSLQPMDIQHMYKLLTVLTRKFGADETIKAVPLVFEIQALSPSPSKHRANAALVVEWLLFVGDFYRIERLIQYAEGLKEAQSDAILNFAKDDVFDDGNQAVPSQLADRKTVVEILSKDGPLRDEDDAQGTDLETKLMVEWGTDAYGMYLAMDIAGWDD